MRACLLLVSIFLLSACDQKAQSPAQWDLAHVPLPYARTRIEPADNFPDPPLSKQAEEDRVLLKSFFRHEFEILGKALEEARSEGLRKESHEHASYRFIEGLRATGLAGIDACGAWLAAQPGAYVAHLACGAMWGSAAWKARSGDYAHKVSPVRFALMRERFIQSNLLLEKALELDAAPVEALTILAANHYGLRDRKNAVAYLERAHQLQPRYASPYEVRANFSLPEWGGSHEEVATVLERAGAAGVDAQALREMQDRFIARPWKMSGPGEERRYWERVLSEHPSATRHENLLKYFSRVSNWRDLVPAADRMLAVYPDHVPAIWMRAVALERLGHIPQAVDGYRTAAAYGHDEAMVSLIQAYVQGGLGMPQGDWKALHALCRHGASLGSAAAANCLGATYWEANKLGPPFHTDVEQALAWHLFAARAGHFNSQYDLGWLLYTGRGPALNTAEASRLGIFWMRRSAEQGHAYAPKRLRDAGLAESEEVEPPATWTTRTAEQAEFVLRVFYHLLARLVGA